jgi:4-hydroxybenzoate polyprenyltransferase
MKKYFSLIVFSHTVFALPFALLGFFYSRYYLDLAGSNWKLGLVVACMVLARSAAMAFNRYLDRDIDAVNPRTVVREIPSGQIKPTEALLLVIGTSLMFIFCTWLINPLCFALSPIALAVVLGYSYTKRFTPLCHLVLGVGLGLAPLGAWLAGGGGFDTIPLFLAFGVMFWVAGFDIIYALQDESFDRAQSLHSIPVLLGGVRALRLSRLLHICCALCILVASWLMHDIYKHLGIGQWVGLGGFLAMLVYQHSQVSATDLSKVNRAFFTANGFASIWFAACSIIDLF